MTNKRKNLKKKLRKTGNRFLDSARNDSGNKKMASIADFVKIPKIDSCKNLSTGLRYSSFTQWANFLLPDFSENTRHFAGTEDDLALRAQISEYTEDRIGSSHDMLLLFCHSISESVSENVTFLNGTINVDFVSKCKNATEFLDVVKSASEKYSDKLKLRPFLGIDTDKENNLPLATMLLESGLFDGIELYGRTYAENPEKFLTIFKTARKMDLSSRICCLGFRGLKNREEIFELIENLCPTHLMNPNIAINNDALKIFKDGKIYPEVVKIVKDKNLQIEFSPAPILSGKKEQEKKLILREFVENDIPFSLCSEDMLYLNKSISEFAADLCNAGVFSIEEMTKIIQK